ncbi:MAG TPA: PilZ domain-containing protein [Vicinamibacteria bacterium]|nr:PilZ domain-containing protein [Vicinamibacteria bacterium]
MPLPILVAGLDARGLPLEAPLLQRDGHDVRSFGSARELFAALASQGGGGLVVLGPRLADADLVSTVERLRASPLTRHVSLMVLLPSAEPEETGALASRAGANAVLRRPLEAAVLEAWIGKLLTVPRRVLARVPVQGHVIGKAQTAAVGRFFGLTQNLSVNGMLLASPIRLDAGDIELEFGLPEARAGLRALGRVVREAGEVAWPYIGYGVEFLFVPEDTRLSLQDFIEAAIATALRQSSGPPAIHSTLRRDFWVYEILEPVASLDGWQAEIRRAPRDSWRPGSGGPFYVVLGRTPQDALAEARGFVHRHG